MTFVLMGVAGCGKTTIGKLLAQKLKIPFYDADDFHSEECLQKMREGIALDDIARMPWLAKLSAEIRKWNREYGAVLACSALKECYRSILSSDGSEKVLFIHLTGARDVLIRRIENRHAHFFPPTLLESQLNILEPPSNGIVVQIDKKPEEIVHEILSSLALRGYACARVVTE